MSRLRRIVLALLILAALGALALWEFSRMAPSWYEPPDPGDPHVAALADQVEYGVLQQAQKIRAPDESRWSIRLSQDQINSWLSARLPQWVAHQGGAWPAQLGAPQIQLEPEGISLALPINPDGRLKRTVVARLVPQLTDRGLVVELERLAFGRIALGGEPLSELLEALRDAAPELWDDPDAQRIVAMIADQAPVDPVFELADGRRVRLIEVKHGPAWVDLAAVTLDEAASIAPCE